MQSQKQLDARVIQIARAVLVLTIACAADFATAAPSVNGILGCRGITDAVARLACFDRESAQIAAATSSPTNPSRSMTSAAPVADPPPPEKSASAVDAPPAAAGTTHVRTSSAVTESAFPPLDPQQTFGLSSAEVSAREEAAGKRPHEVTSITARIVRFSAGGNARVIFRLDNDQVWEQLLSEGDLNASLGDEVEISRGMLGSYWLKDKATARGCKVRRLH